MHTIVIVGGNFINKGAQSMLMKTIQGIRQHFPGFEPVVVDVFPSLTKEEREALDFRVFNLHVRSVLRIAFPLLKLAIREKPISDPEEKIKEVFNTASAVFDISGYGLSSHNQSLLWSFVYLFPLHVARKRAIPMWLLPQSIGPFQFRGVKRLFFEMWGKPLLNYPEVIFAREPSGLESLKEVRSLKTVLSGDIVLQSEETILPKKGKEVLIIPNHQLFKLCGEEKVNGLFVSFINSFVSREIPVKILRHSRDDLEFCQKLARRISHPLLTVDDRDYGLNDLTELICKARFVVTGRYHGAIHALKCFKPVVIVGWAEKYKHLASLFNINGFLVDMREQSGTIDTEMLVDELVLNEEYLKHAISKKLKELQRDNFWNQIKIES
jgi:polysaccharide pyruvyl transferase WcaK-like protein